MMWNGDGSWAWWWLPGLAMFVLCGVMMARMMMSHGGHSSHGSHGTSTSGRTADGSEGAERILADRLARGQIDTEEYERRLAVLQRRQHERP